MFLCSHAGHRTDIRQPICRPLWPAATAGAIRPYSVPARRHWHPLLLQIARSNTTTMQNRHGLKNFATGRVQKRFQEKMVKEKCNIECRIAVARHFAVHHGDTLGPYEYIFGLESTCTSTSRREHKCSAAVWMTPFKAGWRRALARRYGSMRSCSNSFKVSN